MNKLYYGDNLDVLRRFIKDETVDLCYIDPPFNSKRNYNQIYNNIGTEDRAQAQAFMDTWTWDDHAIECRDDILSNKNNVQTSQSIALISGLEKVLGKGSLFAYVVSMTARFGEINRILTSNGSFYIHCDTVADSYLRLAADAIFVPKGGNFRNEITWKRADAHNDAKKQFGMITDRILFYSKGKDFTFHPQYGGYPDKTMRDWYLWLELPDGSVRRMTKQEREAQDLPVGARRFNADNTASPNPRPNLMYRYKGYPYPVKGWRYSLETMTRLDSEGKLLFPADPEGRIMLKRYLDEQCGAVLGDVWTDISQLRSSMSEMLGYPTQKPEALLDRIISASC
jgi:DNA modification methylase